MPTPVNSNCKKKSILRRFRMLLSLNRNDERRASVREFDMLVEDDHAFFVAHDVVAVQAVAEFVEIVFALGALVALGRQDRGADLVGVGRAGLVDGGAENADRVIGPRAVIVRLS